MDILKKMFQSDKPTNNNNNNKQDNDGSASVTVKDEFRKPQWFEETETDDELFDDDRKFAFQVFTNPLELQKHFESQMEQLLEAMGEFDDDKIGIEKNVKEDFLKPGFESKILKEFAKHSRNQFDTDLDGEIYADQLHSIIQRLSPPKKEQEEIPKILPGNDKNSKLGKLFKSKVRLTDEERIMGKIHGTLLDDDEILARKQNQRARLETMTPMTPMIPRGVAPFGGVFEGTYQGPKMFSQSVMTKTIRKPDGSYETTKVTQDSSGKTVTTVSRTINGKTETITTYDGKHGHGSILQKPDATEPEMQVYSDRNIFVSKKGYAVPRNLW